MILYKYVGYEAGLAIIKNNNIGFRQPIYLNDPTELSAAYPRIDYIDERDFLEMSKRRRLKDLAWRIHYAILSLTRAPNNPLMWSHYSEDHKGFVIGFEVNNTFFSSEQLNLIPVQYGNVIYTTTKPIHEFISKSDRIIEVETEVAFIPERFENLQRIFLYKPMYWAYEEEVRVVKNVFRENSEDKFQSGDFEIIKVNGHDLFVHSLPKNTIKEIYFGFKNSLIQNNNGERNELIKQILSHSSDVKFYMCVPDEITWDFIYFEIPSNKCLNSLS